MSIFIYFTVFRLFFNLFSISSHVHNACNLHVSRLAISWPLISSYKWVKRATMHEVAQRPSERRSLEVDLFRVNGFESFYKFTREKKKKKIDICCVGSGVKFYSLVFTKSVWTAIFFSVNSDISSLWSSLFYHSSFRTEL